MSEDNFPRRNATGKISPPGFHRFQISVDIKDDEDGDTQHPWSHFYASFESTSRFYRFLLNISSNLKRYHFQRHWLQLIMKFKTSEVMILERQYCTETHYFHEIGKVLFNAMKNILTRSLRFLIKMGPIFLRTVQRDSTCMYDNWKDARMSAFFCHQRQQIDAVSILIKD